MRWQMAGIDTGCREGSGATHPYRPSVVRLLDSVARHESIKAGLSPVCVSFHAASAARILAC